MPCGPTNPAGWTYAELPPVSFVSATSVTYQRRPRWAILGTSRFVSLTTGAGNATCVAEKAR
jgi:hypothetical protein